MTENDRNTENDAARGGDTPVAGRVSHVPELHSLDDVVAELGIDEGPTRDRMTIHIEIDEAATREEADAFFDDLADFVAEWVEQHPERGEWDPFVHSHTESCDDSDHCHGPGSVVERRIAAKALRDHADEVERELVCCDAYDGKGSAGKHQVCYWAGAAVASARRRADEVAR